MATVAEVLAEFDIIVSEQHLAAELRALIGRRASAADVDLTDGEDDFLSRHGGVGRATRKQLASLAARSGATLVDTVTDSLSRTEAAQQLGIAPSRVSHRVAAGQLYSYSGSGGRRRFPAWQFLDDAALPHLPAVMAALPPGAHPALVRSFMTTPLDALRLRGHAVSPARWLASGGAVDPVAAAAGTLGEQV